MVSGDAHDDSEWKCDAHVTRDFPALRSRNPRALSRAASAHSPVKTSTENIRVNLSLPGRDRDQLTIHGSNPSLVLLCEITSGGVKPVVCG